MKDKRETKLQVRNDLLTRLEEAAARRGFSSFHAWWESKVERKSWTPQIYGLFVTIPGMLVLKDLLEAEEALAVGLTRRGAFQHLVDTGKKYLKEGRQS